MKRIKILTITALFILTTITGFAQTRKITLTARNLPIKEALAQVQQKSGYRILYNDEVVADDLRVSVNAESVTVKSLLNIMLQNTPLTFVWQSADLIVITRKEFISDNKILGMVVDENNEPVPFANVVLLSLPDSTFINGVSTGVNGRFSLDRKDDRPVLLEITYLGYERFHSEVTSNNLGNIQLKPETTLLGEVVVTAKRPAHKMEADGVVTGVQNTLLARLGTANDVLAQLPFVKGQDGAFTVFGRGTPLIYINNRLLRDNNELRQLSSDDIKDVKVILTPGSQYDASVGSVIRINTVKAVGEGWSGQLYGYINQRRLFSHYEYANLNYRKGGWDIFGTLSFYKSGITQNQEDDNGISLDKQYLTQTINKQNFNFFRWDSNVGINYSFSPYHLIGVRYNFSQIPKSRFYIPSELHHFVDDVEDASLKGEDTRIMARAQNYFNVYYHQEFKNNTLFHFEGDMVKGNNHNNQLSEFENTNTAEKTTVENSNMSNYSLYAVKAFVETPLLGGKITIGSDASFTDNKQDYKMFNKEIADDLPSNKNNAIQKLVTGFATYDYTWGKVAFSTGLRYEHINFEYLLNGKQSDEQSRVYNNLFPTFSLSYNQKDISMSLGYRTIVRRPNYFNLRSSIAYNNPYAYEGGNPSLQPMYTHKLSYLFGWKDVQAEISYNWIKDNLLFVGMPFKDKPISLATMVNLPQSQRLDTYISYSPTISWWKPTYSIGVHKQNLTYEGRTYNKPYITCRWSNLITLPRDFMLNVNMRGNLEGNDDVLLYKSGFRADIRLNKQFLNKKLSATLFATDIFATDKERWLMHTGNRYFSKWNDGDNRGIYLILSYKFNTTRSKYKGKGAAKDEMNRL